MDQGPITVSNIRYTAGSNGTIEGSASNGPVQLQFPGGGAVGPPFSLVTADTSNAWITDISVTGGNVSQAIILPSPPVTLNPITIAEHLTDAFGPAGTATDVCLDLSGLATWSAAPTSSATGTVPSDAINGIVIDNGPGWPVDAAQGEHPEQPDLGAELHLAHRHEGAARHCARQGAGLPH